MARNKKNSKATQKRNLTAKRVQKENRQPKANRKYKDTVFRMLFSDRENLLSLYNAVRKTTNAVDKTSEETIGTVYADPEQLEIVTLNGAVYMGMKNDLAFIIDMNLFLYEHQSTYNPNIPLRDLFYISAEYQKLVDHRSLYSSALQKISAPYFIVFYNGTGKKEEYWENSLSEAYENQTGEPRLELKVITLNINEGNNRELMEQCRTLREYAQYVEKVRRYTKEMELDAAVERAVSECIQEGILEEFLRANRAEVIAVSIFEFDKDEEEKKLRKAEYEAGKLEGIEEGINKGKIEMIRQMLKEGESIEKIARYAGYKIEEVEKIKTDDDISNLFRPTKEMKK